MAEEQTKNTDDGDPAETQGPEAPDGTIARHLSPDEIREKTRNEIIARVGTGEGKITPEQAEKAAAAAGVGPLACHPPKNRFDPFREPDWSLPMTAAWIIYRTPDAVREAWPPYRGEISVWRDGGLHPPADIEFRLWDVLESPARFGSEGTFMTGETAWHELRDRLHNGELVAMGVPAGEKESRAICKKPDGTSEWSMDHENDDPLTYLYYVDGPADAIGGEFDLEPRYTKVKVKRDDVLAIWGPRAEGKMAIDGDGVGDDAALAPEQGEQPRRRRQSKFAHEFLLGKIHAKRLWDAKGGGAFSQNEMAEELHEKYSKVKLPVWRKWLGGMYPSAVDDEGHTIEPPRPPSTDEDRTKVDTNIRIPK